MTDVAIGDAALLSTVGGQGPPGARAAGTFPHLWWEASVGSPLGCEHLQESSQVPFGHHCSPAPGTGPGTELAGQEGFS